MPESYRSQVFACDRKGTPIPDTCKIGLWVIKAVLAQHRNIHQFFIQTDPRGTALYIIDPEKERPGMKIDCCYSMIGIGVY